jgi:hypothetical protein
MTHNPPFFSEPETLLVLFMEDCYRNGKLPIKSDVMDYAITLGMTNDEFELVYPSVHNCVLNTISVALKKLTL